MDEDTYNSLQIVDLLSQGVEKKDWNFHWIIKPSERLLFTKGRFYGEYHDNGLLRLRETIRPGSIFTEANRPYADVDHVVSLEGFISQIRGAEILKEQAAVGNALESLELEDPDGSLAPQLERAICPICMDPCFSPSFVCINGHNLCGRCRTRLSAPDLECPTCRLPAAFGQPLDTNSAIADALEFKCRYSLYGCQTKVCGSGILHHIEKDCCFRPFKCYFCMDIFHVTEILNHVMSKHEDKIPIILKAPTLPSKFSLEVPLDYSYEKSRDPIAGDVDEKMKLGCFAIKTDGLFFLLELQLMYGTFAWGVGFLGPSTQCSKYVADITLVTDYDIGRGRPTERITDVFLNQPIPSCQDDVATILTSIMNANYPDGFAKKDYSQYGGAGRYHSILNIEIRYCATPI